MIKTLQIIAFFVFVGSVRAQIATEFGTPIKWDKNFDRTKYIMTGLDTLSIDSILIDRERYIRQNQEGSIIEEIYFSKLNTVSCDDEGPKLTGYWTSYYDTGEIKEIGKIICNRKFGEWKYFYKSGQLKRFEKYDGLDIINLNPNFGYLNGTFLEYHSNGKIKTSGVYKIIDNYDNYNIVNQATYKIEKRCCVWKPKSIKYGEWIEYDNSGEIESSKLYTLSVKDSINLRELYDRFLEININELRTR